MTAADLQIGSRFLLDTNVLLRLQSLDRADAAAHLAVRKLQLARAQLHVAFQNVSEFWNSCTRPDIQNGLGLSIQETTGQLQYIEDMASLLIDRYDTYQRWRELLVQHGVTGKQVHDTRLVATMLVYNVPYLLTYNTKNFRRFRTITAVHPEELV